MEIKIPFIWLPCMFALQTWHSGKCLAGASMLFHFLERRRVFPLHPLEVPALQVRHDLTTGSDDDFLATTIPSKQSKTETDATAADMAVIENRISAVDTNTDLI